MVNAVSAVERRKKRNRYAVKRSAAGRNRLVVHRTNQHIYAQLIDDSKGVVVAQASTLDKELASALKAKSNIDAAKKVGDLIAKRAKDKKVTEIVFDRGPYLYHGRIKALAEAAREGGLKF